ncbi:hypothetical protein DJ535_00125 [Citrobacter murliniae]|uniref:Fimbrial biogenesis outer membrane usher protein n=1 Tax=Citrobacter murliniae TaxID=67829 RepID=A0ABY2PYY9_9ENTR|nr:fimbria/pilus outer membrane usher protein [Citrobacter murliniae]THE42310.1 hypothetical protein DJ535_00125 [Citrobacter murliniae]
MKIIIAPKSRLIFNHLTVFVKHSLPLVFSASGLVCSTAYTAEYYFDSSMLETQKSGMQPTDLSLFSQEKSQLPGDYRVDIYLNKNKIGQKTLTFTANASQQLEPQFTIAQLRELGVKVDDIPALAEKSDDAIISALPSLIPSTTIDFDFNHSRLNMSIPLIALYRDARGYVAPSRWDSGVPALFTNYSFSGSDTRYQRGDQSERQYLNLQNGANVGPWRLRNYSTWNRDDRSSSWNTINSYLQRDIKTLKSQLLIGESATTGSLFSSYQFTGMQLASDDNMLPNSQRGFAPTIRGIANTSAIITVRQNDYIIYQSNVPAGAFEINDLYPSASSGDLDITIEESDGSLRHFVQPYSSLPLMQRPGRLKYSVTAGKFRATNSNDSDEPEFAEGTAIYGLNNTLTLYGGLLGAENYQSLGAGVGSTLGMIGALAVDITRADSQFDDQQSASGYQWRTQYTKEIPETGTNLSLSYYRYTSSGFFTFSDANAHGQDSSQRQRSQIQLNLSQSLFGSVSFYTSGSQRDYWNSGGHDRNLSLGINGQIAGIGYNLSGQFTDYDEEDNDRTLSLSLSIPLDRWLPHSRASYRMTNKKDRATQNEARLDGSLLQDNRLSYSLKQTQDTDNNHSSSLGSSYRSAYGTFNANYDYSNDSRQYSYGASGGIVMHRHGVTLSQPLGNSFALIDLNGAPGVRVQNYPGIATDPFGYAVIPYLTSYQENRISLDTTLLPDDVDVQQTTQVVVPNNGAVVTARFTADIGLRVLVTLRDKNGNPVPFGARASNPDSGQENIVDEGGVLYLAGVSTQPQPWTVQWGNQADQQCQFTFSLPAGKASKASVLRGTAQCL